MFKSILKNGIIAGLIVACLMDVSIIFIKDYHELGMVIGYASMLIAFSFIFIGIKNYRDTQLGGIIKFGHAFLIGLGIAVIGTIIYVINWEIYMYFTKYTFMAEYSANYIEGLKAKGVAANEILKAKAELDKMIVAYKNPIYRMLFTISEILPVGLVVSLICAFILKNPKAFPAR